MSFNRPTERRSGALTTMQSGVSALSVLTALSTNVGSIAALPTPDKTATLSQLSNAESSLRSGVNGLNAASAGVSAARSQMTAATGSISAIKIQFSSISAITDAISPVIATTILQNSACPNLALNVHSVPPCCCGHSQCILIMLLRCLRYWTLHSVGYLSSTWHLVRYPRMRSRWSLHSRQWCVHPNTEQALATRVKSLRSLEILFGALHGYSLTTPGQVDQLVTFQASFDQNISQVQTMISDGRGQLQDARENFLLYSLFHGDDNFTLPPLEELTDMTVAGVLDLGTNCTTIDCYQKFVRCVFRLARRSCLVV